MKEAEEILIMLKGAKEVYSGGYHEENTRKAFKDGIETCINCVQAYIEKDGLKDSQLNANFRMGLE